jgi:hypothetical protein
LLFIARYLFPLHPMMPALKMQEVPFTDPPSHYHFQPSGDEPFVATPAAIEQYGDVFWPCLRQLQALADERDGIDYLQVFEDPSKPEPLWFIEDDAGGAITALLPSDY